MVDAGDVTQSPQYLELFKVSEEMEADFLQQVPKESTHSHSKTV